jgi:hypothetical protein
MAKSSNVFIKFCVKLSKSTTETFEVLCENILYAKQLFLNGIRVSRPAECQLKMTNVQGDQATTKLQKMLKKFENSSIKTVAKQSMSSKTPLGSVMEFARRS